MGFGATLATIMDSLRVCLETELAATVAGEACAVALVPGQQVVADWCTCSGRGGCGMAYVRLARLYPSSAFPQVDQTVKGSCAAPQAAQIDVGVLRCLPTLRGDGSPPDPAEQTAAALAQVSDAAAIHTVLTCCPVLEKRDRILGVYLPTDQGGCGGGYWPMTVRLIRVPGE